MKPQIPIIELGTVVPGAVALNSNDKGVNETFIGHVDIDTTRHKAYIKVLDTKQLANELLANTLGRILQLPMPRGFLLKVRPVDLPDSVILKNFGQEAIVFGTQSLKHPSLLRHFKGNGEEVNKWIKANFNLLDEVIVFDDFVANVDRNQGNLLVGGAGQVWLIDHGHCFTGCDWKISSLIPNAKYTNKMANEFSGKLSLSERMKLKEKAKNYAEALDKVDKKAAINACHLNQLLPSDELEALEKFIVERVNHIVNIISDRVGVPTLGGGA